MIFIKTKRGLINANYIVRVNQHHEYRHLVYIEYHASGGITGYSDGRNPNVTICHALELDKLNLFPSDLDLPEFPANA